VPLSTGLYNLLPMSLITRCPACQTLFKVVPDQFRVSEGWVRCGQCEEIFDGSLHLQPEPLVELATAPFVESPTEVLTETSVVPPVMAEPPPLDISPSKVELTPAALFQDEVLNFRKKSVPKTVDASIESLTAAHPTGSADVSWVKSADTEPATGVAIDTVTTDAVTRSSVAADVDPRVAPDADDSIPEPAITFLSSSRSTSRWHKPWVRGALALVSVCLVILLALQALFHQRDRVAALVPGVKPWLVAACESLDCKISPLRQIESIVIDSSSFTKIRGDVYRMGFAVKNTAPLELALPALELTLTDAQDQAVLRRVFTPTELAATSNSLAAGGEWTGTLALNVRTNPSAAPGTGTTVGATNAAGAERIAGYRLLAFYP